MMRAYVLVILLLPNLALAFGSATILGMRNEHARITQAALSCNSTFDELNKPIPCFEAKTMSNLGGESFGAFPAVESPDNLALHYSGGPDWWHCDNSDYVPDQFYKQTRKNATDNLFKCRKWSESLLRDGLKEGDEWYDLCKSAGAKDYRCTGVAALARLLLNTRNQVDISQPDYFSLTSGCTFNGSAGRIKCEVLQQFGYALHVVQDFYSHSNYADYTEFTPINWMNPIGLLSPSLPVLFDFRWIPSRNTFSPIFSLSTGCYPDNACMTDQRTPHLFLNKDRALIDPISGYVSDPRDFRGNIQYNGILNETLAVEMAIRQTRATWMDLQSIIIEKEGEVRGRKIICAIASDNPNKNCNGVKASSDVGSMSASDDSPIMEPDPTKLQPFTWMMDHYKSEVEDSYNPLLARAKGMRAEPDQIVGFKSTKSVSCGDRVLFKRWGMPDDDPSLTAYDMHVSGVSCAKAVTLLQRYKLFYSSKNTNGKRFKAPEVQCVVMSEYHDSIPGVEDDPAAVLVCKNKNQTKEISFHPDCASNSEGGHCGL